MSSFVLSVFPSTPLTPALTTAINIHKSTTKGKVKNLSGITGVAPSGNGWCAHIRINGKKLHLGYFKEKNDAAACRKEAECKYSDQIKQAKADRYDKKRKYFTEEERNLAQKEYFKNYRERNIEYFNRHKLSHPLETLINYAKQRARRSGLEFNLDTNNVSLTDNCQCCGKKMYVFAGLGTGQKSPRSVTIDRLDGAKGYVFTNVRFICWQCNRLKSDCVDPEQFLKLWMYMVKNKVSPKKIPNRNSNERTIEHVAPTALSA